MARNKYDVDEELEESFQMRHVKRLLPYLAPYRRPIAVTIFMMLVANAAMMVGPLLMRTAIDDMIPAKNVTGILFLAAAYIVALLVNSVCMRQRIKTMSEVAQKVIARIRLDLFEHLQKLPFTYYDTRPHGKILIRVVNYVNSLNDLVQNGFINLISDMFSLISIVVYMLIISPKLTLVSFAGLPLLFLALFALKGAQRKRWQAVSRKQSNINAYLHESLCGIKVTQSFAREEENKKIFSRLGMELQKYWIKAVGIILAIWPISESISILSLSFLYLIGLSMVSGGMSVGVLVAFTGYMTSFWMPIMNIAQVYNQIIIAMAYMERIFETLDEPVPICDEPNAIQLPSVAGRVAFDHVTFQYEEGPQVLNDINFTIEPGKTVAIVGPTGSGKTTIVNLLTRFYDATQGVVSIDGYDVRSVTLSSLRRQMGVMMQDSFIFSGTVRDNIRYGCPTATDDEVEAAAKAVCAHEFIVELENGYDTEVNERGSRLSVGQRQLISFARALLAEPKILILDEATSSIDTRTEQALQKGLNRLMKGRTSFVIAHRLSTIRHADIIFFIENGRIAECGNHDELMGKGGLYKQLVESQNRNISQSLIS